MKQKYRAVGFLVMTALFILPQAHSDSLYVMAGAPDGGSGTETKPFNSLSAVEASSTAGDTIYLLRGREGALLDGGIALKPGQKLLGTTGKVRLTNTTSHLDGVCVELSDGNEVAGIHFENINNNAIHAIGVNLSGTIIRDILVKGCAKSEDVIYAIFLESKSGSTTLVDVSDCVIRDGDDMGGILIAHSGDSKGNYVFTRNHFSDLGGRAYMIWSRNTSQIVSRIEDSTADNIGIGDRNSDSILPRLWGQSEQMMSVRNYHYKNSKQVGNISNCGFEVFLMGEPFKNEDEWCDGCEMTLEITDSVFENTITDGIQLTNYGSNSTMDLAIRRTKVIGANPQQGGGAISLIAQNQHNSGGKTKLLVEDCDIVDSGKYGVAILDRSSETNTSIVDFGGGALGSKGNNRIVNSKEFEAVVVNGNPVAKNVWWGTTTPRIAVEGKRSSIQIHPFLKNDIRRN